MRRLLENSLVLTRDLLRGLRTSHLDRFCAEFLAVSMPYCDASCKGLCYVPRMMLNLGEKTG